MLSPQSVVTPVITIIVNTTPSSKVIRLLIFSETVRHADGVFSKVFFAHFRQQKETAEEKRKQIDNIK